MTGSLADIVDGYLDLRWQMDPVAATWAGGGRHELDGTFARYDAASVREHVAALRSYTAALEEASADSLDDEIDRTAVLHDARYRLLVLERQRPFAVDPGLHLREAIDGLTSLLVRNAQDPPRRGAALLERLLALPDHLEQAVAVVTDPARALVDAASALLPAALALVQDGLDDPSVDLSVLDPAELEHARSGAVDALLGYGDALALQGEGAGAAGAGAGARAGTYALGRDQFDRTLHTAHMIREGADELMRWAERARSEAEAELVAAAREVTPAADWRDVIGELRGGVDEGVGAYRRALERAREGTSARGLMDASASEVRVLTTPAYLRACVREARYIAPGAFDAEQFGTLFVTSSEGAGGDWEQGRDGWVDGATGDARASEPEIALRAARDGVPGRHRLATAANGSVRMARRVIGTPATSDGWALYAESLLVESGWFASPRERALHAYHLLRSAVRAIVDVSLHTKGMSVEGAAHYLHDALGLDAGLAAAEATALCARPTHGTCEAVGRRELMRLRDDATRERARAFSLATFHDDVLRYGRLPAALARWGLGLA